MNISTIITAMNIFKSPRKLPVMAQLVSALSPEAVVDMLEEEYEDCEGKRDKLDATITESDVSMGDEVVVDASDIMSDVCKGEEEVGNASIVESEERKVVGRSVM